MVTVEYSSDLKRIDIERVHAWLRDSYWFPKIRRDILEKAMQNSLCMGAFNQESGIQVGFARLVTDYSTFGYLCDVIVDENTRGQGIGREMVRRLLDDPAISTLRRICLATRDAHEVYRPLGFEEIPPGRFMQIVSDPSIWQED